LITFASTHSGRGASPFTSVESEEVKGKWVYVVPLL